MESGDLMNDINGRAIRELFADSDDIDRSRYVIARYSLRAERISLRQAASHMALIASLGTVSPLPFEQLSRRIDAGPRILTLPDNTAGIQQIEIAFPAEMFIGPDCLTQLYTVTSFAAEYNYVDDMRLEAVSVPKSVMANLAGPRFGLSGIRDRLDISDRPIFACIAKPRLGVPLETIVSKCRSALEGGADMIIDDELIVDPPGELAFLPRVKAMMEAVAEVERKSGKPKGLVVNVTSGPGRCVELAQTADQLGALGVQFNGFVGGIASLQYLVDSLAGTLPVFACNIGSGLLTRDDGKTGMDHAVLTRFSRLAGADAIQTGIVAGAAYTTQALNPSVLGLAGGSVRMKRSAPIVAGGFSIANLWRNWKSVGSDVIFAAGSGVLGSPSGPQAAAEAITTLLTELHPDLTSAAAYKATMKISQKNSGLAKELDRYSIDRDSFVGGNA